VGDIFKAISTGFARFVFAWLTPSVVTVGIFAVFLWPEVQSTSPFRPMSHVTGEGATAAAIIFTFSVVVLAVTFAYASLPIYRILEGYSLPGFLRRPLLRRQQREFARVRALERRFVTTGKMPTGVTIDDFRRFPESPNNVRATRLGNALTAMESWASERYHLDSLLMWHELQGVSRASVRRDTDEGRAPVDFFVSSIAHMALLFVASVVIAALLPHAGIRASVIAVAALLVIPASYRLAVKNMVDWAQSVKAMVNLGRADLANALGLHIPARLEGERRMWLMHYWAVELNQPKYLERYNRYRRPRAATRSPADAERSSRSTATPKVGA
jgi:hypothetical protein